MKIKGYAILALFLLTFLTFPLSLRAAEVYFAPIGRQFKVGDILRIEIRITSEETLNAFELTMFYPQEKLKLLKINEKNSLINLWIQKPSVWREEGKIFFTGGRIGGFRGDGLLAEIIFRAEAPGAVALTFSPDSLALRHDGHGTPEPINFLGGKFTVK